MCIGTGRIFILYGKLDKSVREAAVVRINIKQKHILLLEKMN